MMTRRNFFKNALSLGAAGLILPPTLLVPEQEDIVAHQVEDKRTGLIMKGKVLNATMYHSGPSYFEYHQQDWREVIHGQCIKIEHLSRGFMPNDWWVELLEAKNPVDLVFPMGNGLFYSGRFFLSSCSFSFDVMRAVTSEWHSIGAVKMGTLYQNDNANAIVSRHGKIF